VFGYDSLSSTWAVRIYFANAGGKILDVLFIQFSTPVHGVIAADLPLFRVGFTFIFRSFEGLIFHKEALSLISLARLTPF
jgi:hypothetical protein